MLGQIDRWGRHTSPAVPRVFVGGWCGPVAAPTMGDPRRGIATASER